MNKIGATIISGLIVGAGALWVNSAAFSQGAGRGSGMGQGMGHGPRYGTRYGQGDDGEPSRWGS